MVDTRASSKATRPSTRSSNTPQTNQKRRAFTVTRAERERMIAENAYFRAEQRGFRGGDPKRDWREAEREIDERILRKDLSR